MAAPVYLVLLHYPILNRKGEILTTSVTNLDVHDISRTSRTYGIEKYFIVTPIEPQRLIVQRIIDHWRSGASQAYHPDRAEALSIVELKESFAAVKNTIFEAHGEWPEVVMTDARPLMQSIGYAEYRKVLEDPSRTRPVVIVFGTGWGIAEPFYPEVHRFLAPLHGPKGEGGGGYNHLSVRAAVAAILDRLLGC